MLPSLVPTYHGCREEDLPEGSPALTTPLRWLYAAGAVAAWPCLGDLALAMFPTSRSSPVLSLLGCSYHQALWVHKLAGRASLLWLSIHGAVVSLLHPELTPGFFPLLSVIFNLCTHCTHCMVGMVCMLSYIHIRHPHVSDLST